MLARLHDESRALPSVHCCGAHALVNSVEEAALLLHEPRQVFKALLYRCRVARQPRRQSSFLVIKQIVDVGERLKALPRNLCGLLLRLLPTPTTAKTTAANVNRIARIASLGLHE
jgi:hypothetical protein